MTAEPTTIQLGDVGDVDAFLHFQSILEVVEGAVAAHGQDNVTATQLATCLTLDDVELLEARHTALLSAVRPPPSVKASKSHTRRVKRKAREQKALFERVDDVWMVVIETGVKLTLQAKARTAQLKKEAAAAKKEEEVGLVHGGESASFVDQDGDEWCDDDTLAELWKRAGPLDRDTIRSFRNVPLVHNHTSTPKNASTKDVLDQLCCHNLEVAAANHTACDAIHQRNKLKDRAFVIHAEYPNTMDHMSARQWLATMNGGGITRKEWFAANPLCE